MKPARFGYHRVTSVNEALDALSAYQGTARLLAGGQSLVPMLNMRLLRPDALIDVTEVDEVRTVEDRGETIVVGASVRYCELETSEVVQDKAPLIASVLPHIGDRQIRNRGTIGGALAHGDPTSEMALACLVLDARVRLRGPRGSRTVPVAEFLVDSYATSADPLEMLTAVEIPVRPAGRTAFTELCRRHNDFAVISVACLGVTDDGSSWREMRIGLGGVAATPVLADQASRMLAGTSLSDADIDRSAETLGDDIDPATDIRASAAYRRHLGPVYLRRALKALREGMPCEAS